jgi:hypothetical protein
MNFKKLATQIRNYIKLAKDDEPTLQEINKSELAKGLRVEKEHNQITHGNKPMEAMIAMDHLQEVPDYYSKLKKYVEPE